MPARVSWRLWRAEINQVEEIARAKSLWQKGVWPVRTERTFTWLEQRESQLHAVGGHWRCGKGPSRPMQSGQSCAAESMKGRHPLGIVSQHGDFQ